jgi:hypothetical protein
VFLNMCESDKVGKASCRHDAISERRGLHWQIPLSVTSPREDTDKSGKRVDVYDAIFHPECYALGLEVCFYHVLQLSIIICHIFSQVVLYFALCM